MLAATFGDPHQDFAVSAGELPGNEADRGRKVATVLELRSIANCGHNCGSGFAPHTLDLGNSLASFIAAKDGVDLLVEGSYAFTLWNGPPLLPAL
jgi:hypothetical protein